MNSSGDNVATAKMPERGSGRIAPWLRRVMAAIVLCVLAASAARVAAQTPVHLDGVDAVIRKTDFGGDGVFDASVHQPPELLLIVIGTFEPDEPWEDRFDGEWRVSGGFLRCDLLFDGLVCPPGPLGWDDDLPEYDPFKYGDGPVFGYVEFDVDSDKDTGGELDAPHLRYTGNVGRFGGKPHQSYLADRVALDSNAFDFDVTTAPFVDRSGEEFHIAFMGERIDEIDVVEESSGGDPDVFEPGEVWDVEGELFHRAHGFEQFEFRCPWHSGEYEPEVVIRFSHDIVDDQTTVSLVYPLRNSSAAKLEGPTEPVEGADGCDDNQNSIQEALMALKFSATNADPFDRTLPEFQLIAGWEFGNLGGVLDARYWRIFALLGSAYETLQPDNARFVWTDAYPNPVPWDFNGDGVSDDDDVAALGAYIADHDGDPFYDADGQADDKLEWPDFAAGFCLFDTNYDGFVNESDLVVLGDLDLNQVLDLGDVDDFVQALLSPQDYASTHGGVNPISRGDFNADARLDGEDVQHFVDALLALQS